MLIVGNQVLHKMLELLELLSNGEFLKRHVLKLKCSKERLPSSVHKASAEVKIDVAHTKACMIEDNVSVF